jgi:hypothetical protein
MKFRKSLLAGICMAALAIPVAASAAVVYLNVAPPEPRHERVPPPRVGYVWSQGYWDAQDNRHVWRTGRWERERKGYHYTQSTWTQRDNRWQLERRRWNKGDRDGDGVPNSMDRAPDNPNRR